MKEGVKIILTMAVKTQFSADYISTILVIYGLGPLTAYEPVAQGTVQTNYFLITPQGKYVLKCYENRSFESVKFETQLLAYLKERAYPCPAPIRDWSGNTVSLFKDKPTALFEFMEGQPVDRPDEAQQKQLIQKAAELHNLTRGYRPRYKDSRWNYGVDLCRSLAREQASRIDTPGAYAKLAWYERRLETLQLPRALPKGICHCDFHPSNVLFRDGHFAALLDFDDANVTYLVFDLVGLIEPAAWPYAAETLDLVKARGVVAEYMKTRPLNALEKRHLWDVYQLSILTDCIWYFGRGEGDDFYEKRKLEALDRLGRERFYEGLFKE
jgi:homoserine kinase type II